MVRGLSFTTQTKGIQDMMDHGKMVNDLALVLSPSPHLYITSNLLVIKGNGKMIKNMG